MFWDKYRSWNEAEEAWDAAAKQAAAACPLKDAVIPLVPAIAPGETGLRWKGLWWVLKKDKGLSLVRRLLRRPFRYAFGYLRSVVKRSPSRQEGDLFFYGLSGLDELKELLGEKESFLVLGFSYCQKPLECPCGRFSDGCLHALDNPVCRQCTIGKAMHALPRDRAMVVVIPTINSIGSTILEAVHSHRRVVFIITACALALEMFSDMGNMAGIRGVGIRLGGRVCNTFRAFELSEKGIKPGVTVVPSLAQRTLFDLLRTRREAQQAQKG